MKKDVSANRRYLALFFPFLSADRTRCEERRTDDGPPRAFVEKVKGAMRIAALDPAAHALGLAPGLTLADARARVPELEAIAHDPFADAAWLERLCDGCQSYTPSVALDPVGGLMLDITGCAHLHGGEAELTGDLLARLARLGMTVRHAIASTPEAAHALARFGIEGTEGNAIRHLPVEALRLDDEATLALKRAGLRRIGDLADRPVAALAARFGAHAVDALERLLECAVKPIAPRRVASMLVCERRFAEPIARTEYVLAMLEALASEAALALEERKQGGRRFEVRLFRADGLVVPLAVETGLPTRDPPAIMRLFRERIDTLADSLDPGFGFDRIRLAVPVVEPLAAEQLRLEGGAIAEAEVAALIDRLSARLGRGRLLRFAPRDTHIPEQAQLAFPAVERRAPARWPAYEPSDPPMRPLHLFDPPQPIEVVAEVPDGPPHQFRWRRARHEVTRFEGPERIAAEWWRRRDGKGITRDYYRLEDARGRRYWVFRHGLYDEGEMLPRWYMHGVFA